MCFLDILTQLPWHMDLHFYSAFPVYRPLRALYNPCHIHLFTHTFIHCSGAIWSSASWSRALQHGAGGAGDSNQQPFDCQTTCCTRWDHPSLILMQDAFYFHIWTQSANIAVIIILRCCWRVSGQISLFLSTNSNITKSGFWHKKSITWCSWPLSLCPFIN